MSGFYRQPAEPPRDPYRAAWSKLRRRRWGLRIASAAIFGIIVPLVACVLAPEDQRAAGVALGLTIAMPLVLFVVALVPGFLCPACRQPFFASPGGELGRSNACAACGIPAGAPRPSSLPAPLAGPEAARLGPGALAGWLLVTLGAAFFGYRIAHDEPPLETAGFALAAAGALTVFVGQARASRSFPRSLLVPVAAFILSLFLGARVCVPPGPSEMSARGGRCAEAPSAPHPR